MPHPSIIVTGMSRGIAEGSQSLGAAVGAARDVADVALAVAFLAPPDSDGVIRIRRGQPG